MSGELERNGMQAVVERLARLEAQSEGRGEAFREMRITMAKLDDKITRLDGKVDQVSVEIKSAQTGFRVALWFVGVIASAISAAAAWLASAFLGK